MRKTFKIYTRYKDIKPDELIRLFHFTLQEADLAAELDIGRDQLTAWKEGKEAVPGVFVRYMQQLERRNTIESPGSPWHGSQANGTRLTIDAGHRLAIEFDELERLADYRRLFHLYTQQADLIERLMMERDFYREQCHKQARFGMVLNSLFPG